MKNLSDEKLDQLLSKLLKDNALSEDAVDDIADSPQLLWNVRRSIAEQKAVSKAGWFAAFNWRIPVFASFALLVCAGIFWSLTAFETPEVVETKAVESVVPENVLAEENYTKSAPNTEFAENEVSNELGKTVKVAAKSAKKPVAIRPVVSEQTQSPAPKSQELAVAVIEKEKIKTDFIALSYSSAAESGQILNVKVPRSMMVALGVTSNVENISELVNAEVVMGDDGLARAIRFVQ